MNYAERLNVWQMRSLKYPNDPPASRERGDRATVGNGERQRDERRGAGSVKILTQIELFALVQNVGKVQDDSSDKP